MGGVSLPILGNGWWVERGFCGVVDVAEVDVRIDQCFSLAACVYQF